MAEHWKSTPRYWCKHCSTYVRDTRLERTNHEATARHQSAVKRSLRELHRGKETEDRERERAKREIERLNGVVSASSRGDAGAAGKSVAGGGDERKRQAEQLALLGVAVPETMRGDMAMAGEWTVTSTTIVEEKPDDENTEAKARGVHKRERTEEEKEHEEAVAGLFKKPRRWGRDSKTVDGDGDLDALLSGGLEVKKEEAEDAEDAVKAEAPPVVKTEESSEEQPIPAEDKSLVKTEEDAQPPPAADSTPVVAFKKRKPKNIRQK